MLLAALWTDQVLYYTGSPDITILIYVTIVVRIENVNAERWMVLSEEHFDVTNYFAGKRVKGHMKVKFVFLNGIIYFLMHQ